LLGDSLGSLDTTRANVEGGGAVSFEHLWPAASKAPDDEGVAVQMTWDADEVGRLLDRRLADDPVRATILGTMRQALKTTSAGCWCAATPDGSAVAVRSDRRYPVVFDGVWPLSDFDELAAVIDSLPGPGSTVPYLPQRRLLPGCLEELLPAKPSVCTAWTLSVRRQMSQASPVGQAAAIVNYCGTGTGCSPWTRMHIGAAPTMRLTPP
jgi:hypothetical protein